MWRGLGMRLRQPAWETEARRGKQRWHPAMCPREAGQLAFWDAGHQNPHCPAPVPSGRSPGPRSHRGMLFPAMATRGRAAPCRNQSGGGADKDTKWEPSQPSWSAYTTNPFRRRTLGLGELGDSAAGR